MNLYLFIVVFIWHTLTSNKITFRFMSSSCNLFKSSLTLQWLQWYARQLNILTNRTTSLGMVVIRFNSKTS